MRRIPLALVVASVAAASPSIAATSADPPAPPDAFAPFAASVGAHVGATWIEPAADGKGASRIRFARFDGSGWSAPTTVAESAALFANWADTPGVVESGDGSLVAWWLEKNGGDTYAYGIRVARSTDGGVDWKGLGWLQDDSSESEHGFVSAAAEGKGARFFWLDGRGMPGGAAMSLRTTTVTEAVAPSSLVDDAVCDCCATASARLGSSAVVVYRDRTKHEIRDIRAARISSGSPGGWSESAVAEDGWKIAGCPVNGPSLVASGDRLITAWFTGADERGRVSVASSTDGGATFSAHAVVDAEKPIGRVALAPLGDGAAALAWYGRVGDAAEVRLARIAAGSGAPSVSPPLPIAKTNGGRRGGVPRVARLGDGRLVLLWTEAGEGPTRLRGAVVPPAELAAGTGRSGG